MHKDSALYTSPTQFFEDLFSSIQRAQKEIHIQTYILRDDLTGKKLVQMLNEAALRQVKITLVLDAYGSKEFRRSDTEKSIHKSIYYRYFSSLFRKKTLYLGRRLHQKLYIVDEEAWLGGMNISDDYSGMDGSTPWLDFMYKIPSSILPQAKQQIIEILGRRKAKKLGIKNRAILDTPNIRLLRNDWKRRRFEITRTYRKMIRDAKEDLFICGGYFLPGRKTMNAIKEAAQRGVKVKIITGKKSDVPIVNRASSFMIKSLKKRGAEIYVWPHSVVHGKWVLQDQTTLCLGSHNLNALSDYGSIELNFFIQKTEPFYSLMQIPEQCEIEWSHQKSSLRDFFSYLLVRMALFIYLRISEN